MPPNRLNYSSNQDYLNTNDITEKEMCTINKAPESLNLKYTNIEKLANELHKKDIDELNKVIDK